MHGTTVRRSTIVLTTGLVTLVTVQSACVVDGRARRTEALVSALSPELYLGQSLGIARSALPSLQVRHRGGPRDALVPASDAAPQVAEAIVVPEPLVGDHAATDARIDGVVYVMSPQVAAQVRGEIARVLRHPGVVTCAGRSIAETDSVVAWPIDSRGGVLLTFPEKRPDGTDPVSRLFIYTGAWHPESSISGYARTDCVALAESAP